MELVTKWYSLEEFYPDLVNQVSKAYHLEGEIPFVRKGFVSSDVKFAEGEKATIDYITTDSIDRDSEIVVPKGIVFDQFQRHPIVPWCHDYKSLPLGKCLWIKRTDEGCVAKTQYAVKSNPFAKQVYEFQKEGFPLGKSLGFIPLEWQDRDPKQNKGLKRVYLKTLTLEYSVVPIPNNPDALTVAVSKGLFIPDHSKSFIYINREEIDLENILSRQKGAIVHKEYPLVDVTWDSNVQIKQATTDDLLEMCAWVADKPKDGLTKGDFSLPHHTVDGYKTVRSAVIAAGNLVAGIKGGVKKIPSSDILGVKTHLEKHYKELDLEVPWEKEEFEQYTLLIKQQGPIEKIKELETILFEEVTKAMAKVICPECDLEFDFKVEEGEEYMKCPECEAKVTSAGKLYVEKKVEDGTEVAQKELETTEVKEVVKDEEDKGIEKKMLDMNGMPSTSDIINALSVALNKKYVNNTVPLSRSDFYYYVQDLYPIAYPNGHAIFTVVEQGINKIYQVEYKYDATAQQATIEVPEEVAPAYVKKSLSELVSIELENKIEQLEESVSTLEGYVENADLKIKEYQDNLDDLKHDILIAKEGRILSTKNRQMIMNCMDALQELLDMTQTKSMDNDVNLDDITPDMISKAVNSIVSSKQVDMAIIEGALEKVAAKLTGKAVSR